MSFLLFGAKGFAKEILHCLNKDRLDKGVLFYDDISQSDDVFISENYKILRKSEELVQYQNRDCIIAVGGASNRKVVSEKALNLGLKEVGLISGEAVIGDIDNKISASAIILSGSKITISVSIGKSTLINKNVMISHDVKVGNYVDIAPNVTLLGGVIIGDSCDIGSSATILPGVKIGDNCRVGAGSVVTRDIPSNSVAYGVPAKVK